MSAAASASISEVRAVRKLRGDSVYFSEHVLGGRPWAVQRAIMRSVRDNRETAVRSCHGPGKTWLAGQLALWFLYSHRGSLVITTAPTDRQVKGLLWKEIRKAHGAALHELGGRCLTQELQISPWWFGIGFTTKDYDPARFAGWHARHVFVVIDEACGVTDQIYQAIDGVLTSEHVRKLEIGNPTDPNARFAESFEKERVAKFRIPVWDTPNFTAFGIDREDIVSGDWETKITGPLPYPDLVTPRWVADRFEDWGTDHPLWRAKVEAEFPRDTPGGLIPLAWVEGAEERLLEPPSDAEVELAVDVARSEHGDESVIGQRKGPRARIVKAWNTRDTMEIAGESARFARKLGAARIKVDVVGVGSGVVDRLREKGFYVVEMDAGAKASEPERFGNARSEWAYRLRDRFEDGTIDLGHDETAKAQLCAYRGKFDSSERFVLERKEDLRKRRQKEVADSTRRWLSPDRADVYSMLFAPSAPAWDVL